MAGDELIDRAVLDSLLETVGGDVTFLAELAQEYFDDSPQQLSSMQQALDSGDAESFRRAAHSLKSNSANFGALRLANICRELEKMGKSNTLDGAQEQLTQAATVYKQVQVALEAVANGG